MRYYAEAGDFAEIESILERNIGDRSLLGGILDTQEIEATPSLKAFAEEADRMIGEAVSRWLPVPIAFGIAKLRMFQAMAAKRDVKPGYCIILSRPLCDALLIGATRLAATPSFCRFFDIDSPDLQHVDLETRWDWLLAGTRRALSTPRQLQMCREVIRSALRMIIRHEIAHIGNGHLELKLEQSGQAVFLEIAADSDHEDITLRQCLEFDADQAAVDSISQFPPRTTADSDILWIKVQLLACTAVWIILPNGQRHGWTATHPPIGFRLICASGQIHDLLLRRAKAEPDRYKPLLDWFEANTHSLHDSIFRSLREAGAPLPVDDLAEAQSNFGKDLGRMHSKWREIYPRLRVIKPGLHNLATPRGD